MNFSFMGSNTTKYQTVYNTKGSNAGNFSERSNFIPVKLAALLEQPRITGDAELDYTWDPNAHSSNIYIHPDDPHILHRNPVAQSTDCARGKTGVSSGVHAWQILWKKKEFGSHAVVGVCTKNCPLNMQGYCNLIGSNSESWGWDLISMQSIHNVSIRSRTNGRATDWNNRERDISSLSNRTGGLSLMHERFDRFGARNLNEEWPSVSRKYPCDDLDFDIFSDHEPSIIMLLDMNEGSLSFVINGKYLGICHRGLAGKTLYPAVNSVWGNCEISLRYLNGIVEKPPSLLFLSRHAILEHLSNTSEKSRHSNTSREPMSRTLSPSRDSNDNMSSRHDPRQDRDERVRRLCLPRCLQEDLLNNWY